MMIMFGFEVDTLEIALREQLEYLDKVFIVESSLNQKGVKTRLISIQSQPKKIVVVFVVVVGGVVVVVHVVVVVIPVVDPRNVP